MNYELKYLQFLASSAKNLMILNMGQFHGFPSIVIPSLIGVTGALNPDETLHVSAAQTSWLCECSVNCEKRSWIGDCWLKLMKFAASFAHIAHPIGSLVSGPICDRIGRRRAIMLVTVPLIVAWIVLGYSQSFLTVCFGFLILGFCFGLKESPSVTYVCEIR